MKKSLHLLSIAELLASHLTGPDRFEKILDAIQKFIPCDAMAVLKLEQGQLTPVVFRGLVKDVGGRRFHVEQHPRFKAILDSDTPVLFPSESELPDPYDGLVEQCEGKLNVHACLGSSLIVDGKCIGLITVDALTPGQFDSLKLDTFASFVSLSALSLKNAMLVEALENKLSQQVWVNRQITSANPCEIIGESEAIKILKEEIKIVAPSELAVLIQGDTGTGKELVARSIHAHSLRSEKDMVYINCAALPEELAEAELFGHMKGAFTGAVANRAGKFESANESTLFLDEVGELSQNIQAKLLRVLQTGEVQRVGSDRMLNVNVRIIAATNRDLKKEVMANRFRRDLFHRLSVFPVQVPSLAERNDDVPLLVGYFAELNAHKLGVRTVRFGRDVLTFMQTMTWQGNVRELDHAVSRAVLRAFSEQKKPIVVVELHHLDQQEYAEVTNDPLASYWNKDGVSFADLVNRFQRDLLSKAFKDQGSNWKKTAEFLKLDRGNIHRLAKRLGLKS